MGEIEGSVEIGSGLDSGLEDEEKRELLLEDAFSVTEAGADFGDVDFFLTK